MFLAAQHIPLDGDDVKAVSLGGEIVGGNVMRNKRRERELVEAQRVAREIVTPYCKQINESPALLSILYDIDLLPEQIRLPVNAIRMAAFCVLFSKMTDEQISSVFAPVDRDHV